MKELEHVYNKAKLNPQIVAFPEAEDEKIMRAAYEAAKGGYIKASLVGDSAKLKDLAFLRGFEVDSFTFVDISDSALKENLIELYNNLPNHLLGPKSLSRRLQDPMGFAFVMQAVGVTDVTFAGMNHTTEEVIYTGQTIVGLAEGISTISSIGLANIPGYEGSQGSLIAFGDSAVCANPTSDQLADIAISACDTVKELLDWEPRCALVSYSTLGSGHGDLVGKVTSAIRIANEHRPDLAIDGEFQMDAAIDPEVAAKKVKRESRVAGKANIVIWPDLNVGNVAVKLIQQFAHADAYGPLLQGFRKVVCDCSRGAPISELVGNIIISSVRAAGMKRNIAKNE